MRSGVAYERLVRGDLTARSPSGSQRGISAASQTLLAERSARGQHMAVIIIFSKLWGIGLIGFCEPETRFAKEI